MRHLAVSTFLLLALLICIAVLSDQPKTRVLAEEPFQLSGPSRDTPQIGTNNVQHAVATSSSDEAAIQQVRDALYSAYKDGDAKGFAEIFTAEGEFVDAKRVVFHGRKAIETDFATLFQEMPGSTIEIEFTSVRSISHGVTAADCTTHFKRSATAAAVPGRCHLICTQVGDRWLVASLQELEAIEPHSSHHTEVSQLEWMIGEWVGEGSHSQTHFSCRWDESHNYLLRQFTIHSTGKETITGTQRIGYDPIAGHLRMWIFDSAGGFSDGHFYRDGESWILHTSGVTAEGRIASTTNSFTPIDKSRMTTETIDRVVGGERIVGSEKVTIIRKPTRRHQRSDQSEGRNH